MDKIKELDGIELLPHHSYSPDLAPSDDCLFRSMVHFLRGRKFKDVEDCKLESNHLLTQNQMNGSTND